MKSWHDFREITGQTHVKNPRSVKRIEKYIFLLLAVIAIGLSALYYLLLEQSAPGATDEQYTSAVQKRVKEEMQVSRTDLDSVVSALQKQPVPTFSELFRVPAHYPYFIFRDGQLLYWSDYRFIPAYASLAGVGLNPKLVVFEQGSYVVSHRQLRSGNTRFDVYSLLNIYRQYHSNNTYLQSGYNPDLFALDPQAITEQRQNPYQAIYDDTSAYLFSVVPPRVDAYRNHSTPVNTVILAVLGVVFLGIFSLQLMSRFRAQRRYEWGFVCLLLYLLLLRSLMLYFGVPFLFFESDLFNPKFYATSILAPSLGDLLLNVLVAAGLVFYWVMFYYRSCTYGWMIHRPQWAQILISVGCVVGSFIAFTACYRQLNTIYENAQFTLDITLDIQFSFLKVVCLLVFVTISFIYFACIHLLTSIFLRFNRGTRTGIGVGLILVGIVLSGGIWLAVGGSLDGIYLVNGLYFLLVYLGKFPRTLYVFRYKTSIYLFLAAFCCAILTAYVVYTQELSKQLKNEREFAADLTTENDVFGEFLMSKAQESIQRDARIARDLRADTLMLVRERVQDRIKTAHLDKYLDKYDVDVYAFRPGGQPFDPELETTTLPMLAGQYRKPDYETKYPGIYFVNEAGNQFEKQYVCFIDVPATGAPNAGELGHVVLSMRLRGERPKSVYPELLVDKRFTQNPDTQEYSYAFFGGNALVKAQPVSVKPADDGWGNPDAVGKNSAAQRLLYSYGGYNYERQFSPELLQNPALYTTGIVVNDHRHVAQRAPNGRIVVVSAGAYPLRSLFSNFSFLLLLLVVSVLAVIMGYALHYRVSGFSINYATRIQILLNLAFLGPLILVIIIIIKVISTNFIANQESTYKSNTRNVATNFMSYLEEHMNGMRRSKESMEEELGKIARDADLDITLFDPNGQFYTSTRPIIYESGYLSKRINPQAYAQIIEERENQVLLQESLGNKEYRTAYAGIKSRGGRLLGVLSIPYFYALPELDRQLIEVIANALNVFTVLFVFFLILSYFASNELTRPLEILRQKVRKTDLDRPNDPIAWQSDDEIGLLIQEYNRMLEKLEESKQALAQSEKQSAWQEMAKQVAHEIKNPLTPMKLTLQHLQRTLPKAADAAGTPDPARKVIMRAFDSLLDQIDTLSDIATSFSEFAKMPMPKKEVFEVTSVFNKTADLYAEDKKITLSRDIAHGPIMAIGDRQLMGRTLTNLILNAIQSVPEERRAVIDLRLHTNGDNVQIDVQDNGAGIPKAISSKVFLPNFSTKRDGSGLGLAIAKRGIEHAGGEIWFETAEDEGTTFFVTLPLAKAGVPGIPISEPATY